MPTSRTSRLERFKGGSPGVVCDRWHHCSTARRRRDYTKGLGPLGRFGRKPSVLKGAPQGCRNGPGRDTKRPLRSPGGVVFWSRCGAPAALTGDGVDRAADDAELVADLAAQEEESDDGDDCDQGNDECVFGQSLAVGFAVEAIQVADYPPDDCHDFTSFRARSALDPRDIAGARLVRRVCDRSRSSIARLVVRAGACATVRLRPERRRPPARWAGGL